MKSVQTVLGDERLSVLLNRQSPPEDPHAKALFDNWWALAREQTGLEEEIEAAEATLERLLERQVRILGGREVLEVMLLAAVPAAAQAEANDGVGA